MELSSVTHDQLMNEIPLGYQLQRRETTQSASPIKIKVDEIGDKVNKTHKIENMNQLNKDFEACKTESMIHQE